MSAAEALDPRANFSWRDVLGELGWQEDSLINIGETIIDRHVGVHDVALRAIDKNNKLTVWTYQDLKELSNQIAHLMKSLGVNRGDRIAGILSRRAETIAIMAAAWKCGAVYVPIFPGFGLDAINTRLINCGAKLVFVHEEHRERVGFREGTAIVLIGKGRSSEGGLVDFWQLVPKHASEFKVEGCRRSETAIILYTSGSTGEPKGVEIAANFLAAVRPYMRFGIDLRPTDVFWPTGDPGWGYGLVCYHAALSMGVPVVCYEGPPTPEAALQLLEEHKVTNLATVPTLLRGVMALGASAVSSYKLSLRCISSCGEPLNSEVIRFFQNVLGIVPRDHFGSSENGLPLGNCNALDEDVLPGSMGRPIPGFEIAIVDEAGREVPDGEIGFLAQRKSSHGYYALGYYQDPERTRSLFRGDWIVSGDLAKRDGRGYFWFEGRSDDVIKSSGYRIGPFEVESAILHHPAVAEAGVVGRPDPLKGHVVAAYVTLKPDHVPTPDLVQEIQDTARRIIGSHAYPRYVEVVESLPKTETGKIQRFKLRSRS